MLKIENEKLKLASVIKKTVSSVPGDLSSLFIRTKIFFAFTEWGRRSGGDNLCPCYRYLIRNSSSLLKVIGTKKPSKIQRNMLLSNFGIDILRYLFKKN